MNKFDHIPHLEDLLFQMQPNELAKYIQKIEAAHKVADRTLTIKYDGSPSLIAGEDPLDGKFFVSTKGFFNKTPILYKSQEAIDRIASPGLANVMSHVFARLKHQPFQGNFLQGDLIWCPGSIDHHLHGNFSKTNVLSYKVEAETDIGVVWHTVYDKNGGIHSAGKNEYWEAINRLFYHDYLHGSMVSHLTPMLPAIPTRHVDLDHLVSEIVKVAKTELELYEPINEHQNEYWKKHFPNVRASEVLLDDYARSVTEASRKEKLAFKSQKKHDELNLALFDALRDSSRTSREKIKSYYKFYQMVLEYKYQRLYGYERAGKLKPYTYDVETDVYLPAAIEGLVYRPDDDVACKLVNRAYFTQLNKSSPYSNQKPE